jgi:hypothetical protein
MAAKFSMANFKSSYGQGLLNDISDKGMFAFPTHHQFWDHNKIKLLKVSQSYPIAKVSAISKGMHAHSMESDRADGLQQILFLCKNAKVMLTTHLCVAFGLFNGATGTIIDLIYRNENRPENSLPDVVMVQFDNHSGPPFIEENPKMFPIVPVERKIDCNCCGCRRQQIPLRLG